MPRTTAHHVEVDGRRLKLSNLDKVLYPETGFTKAQLLDYYLRIAPRILPHLHDRAVTLKRYPDGVAADFFFEKNCPSHRPRWVPAKRVTYSTDLAIDHCLIRDRAALAWIANLGAIELHTSLARIDRIDQPTMIVFDLDPGEGVGIRECAQVALQLRDVLESFHLRTLVKASGGKGLHLYLPLNTPVGYDQTRPFAHAVARLIEGQLPDLVVTRMSKALRRNRVLIDWSQNSQHKTTVCVYAMRATPRPAVSAPLVWAEVEQLANGRERLTTDPDAILAATEDADPFAGALHWRQTLPPGGRSGTLV